MRYLAELAALEAPEREDRRLRWLLGASGQTADKRLSPRDLARFPAPIRPQLTPLVEGPCLDGATHLCSLGHPGTGRAPGRAAVGHP